MVGNGHGFSTAHAHGRKALVRVGTCLVYKGRSDESRYRYYTNFPGFGVKPKGGVAVAAESQCAKLKGTWTPN